MVHLRWTKIRPWRPDFDPIDFISKCVRQKLKNLKSLFLHLDIILQSAVTEPTGTQDCYHEIVQIIMASIGSISLADIFLTILHTPAF